MDSRQPWATASLRTSTRSCRSLIAKIRLLSSRGMIWPGHSQSESRLCRTTSSIFN